MPDQPKTEYVRTLERSLSTLLCAIRWSTLDEVLRVAGEIPNDVALLGADGVCSYCNGRGCPACDARSLNDSTELEAIVAGVISTYPPFDNQHPSTALPLARNVLDAMRASTRSFDLLDLDAIRRRRFPMATAGLVNELCSVIEKYREMR